MKIKVKHVLVFILIISFAAAYFYPGIGENEVISTMINFIGILFGIIVGFFITDVNYHQSQTGGMISKNQISLFDL